MKMPIKWITRLLPLACLGWLLWFRFQSESMRLSYVPFGSPASIFVVARDQDGAQKLS